MTPGNEEEAYQRDQLGDLGHLSAAVGHLLINAFSAVVSNAELLRSRTTAPIDPSEIEALGTAMIETSLDASQVARSLIDWARRVTAIDAGRTGREPKLVDLNQLIEEFIESEKSSRHDRVDWALNLAPISSIPGDPAQLRLMLGYLIQNAREALPAGSGSVTISTLSDPRSWMVVTIRDSGRGMTPEVLKRATEPFFTTKPDHRGIGLTVAQGIWRRHRGAVSIESTPGQGTTIRLSVGPFAPPGQVGPGAPSPVRGQEA